MAERYICRIIIMIVQLSTLVKEKKYKIYTWNKNFENFVKFLLFGLASCMIAISIDHAIDHSFNWFDFDLVILKKIHLTGHVIEY